MARKHKPLKGRNIRNTIASQIVIIFISVILFFLSYFPFMTVFTSRTYTYYTKTGETVPDFDTDPVRKTCEKFLLRKTFPDKSGSQESRYYLCFKPNIFASVTTPVLVAHEIIDRENTIYPFMETYHPILIGHWFYLYLVSTGLIWVYKRYSV